MNRHARRALEAKTRRPSQDVATAARALQGIEQLPTVQEIQSLLVGINGVQHILAQANRQVAALEYRLARQEYVFTKMLESIYRGLGGIFGARLNERVPYIEWNARRLVLEAEYDRTHKEAAPTNEPATET